MFLQGFYGGQSVERSAEWPSVAADVAGPVVPLNGQRPESPTSFLHVWSHNQDPKQLAASFARLLLEVCAAGFLLQCRPWGQEANVACCNFRGGSIGLTALGLSPTCGVMPKQFTSFSVLPRSKCVLIKVLHSDLFS